MIGIRPVSSKTYVVEDATQNMATSVKLDERTKSRLEELRAEIRLETDTNVTQQELLDRIVENAYASKEDLIDSFRDEWDGLSEEETEQWLSGTTAAGNPVDEEEIDEVLYGSEIE